MGTETISGKGVIAPSEHAKVEGDRDKKRSKEKMRKLKFATRVRGDAPARAVYSSPVDRPVARRVLTYNV